MNNSKLAGLGLVLSILLYWVKHARKIPQKPANTAHRTAWASKFCPTSRHYPKKS